MLRQADRLSRSDCAPRYPRCRVRCPPKRSWMGKPTRMSGTPHCLGKVVAFAVTYDQVRFERLGFLCDARRNRLLRELPEAPAASLSTTSAMACSNFPLRPPDAHRTGLTPISARKAVRPTTRSSSPYTMALLPKTYLWPSTYASISLPRSRAVLFRHLPS